MFTYTAETTTGKRCKHKADDIHLAAEAHARMHIRVQGSVSFDQAIGENHFYTFTRKGFPLKRTFSVRAN